jgi:predicted membrane-bound spermidine synthase
MNIEDQSSARLMDDLASSRQIRTLYALFFFSGLPALIYQLIWQRALFLIFGVNIESVTIVVTAFMLGLGLGSLAGGWLSQRQAISPLLAIALIELLIGAFGLASLSLFEKTGDLIIGSELITTGVVTLALVVVPTLLMGATLPLLVGHLTRRSLSVGGSVGLLYYFNTIGAAAACVLSAVFLFPFLGMTGSIYVAVGINVVVALGALGAYWRVRVGSVRAQPRPIYYQINRSTVLGLAPAVLVAAVGGFVSLSYEIFFFRTVSFATGSSATAFALTLSAFLLGIASGSRQASSNCNGAEHAKLVRLPINALMKGALVGGLFLPLMEQSAILSFGLIPIAILMIYLLARFWGTLLPYLAEISIPPGPQTGMCTALLYFANIVGSAAGSIATGFVLMNVLGLAAIGITLAAVSIACLILLIFVLPMPRRDRITRASAALAIGLLAVAVAPYGSASVLESLQWKGAPDARSFASVVETRSGIIAVTKDGIVFGNGMYDGRFNTDLRHDTNGIVRPFALSLFHPAPHDVLMIGLSSGSWAQVIANNPHVRSLTVIEINPGYLPIIAGAPEVSSVLTNPKITILIDDGRRWLRANPSLRFDAIVSNTTWHFRASVTNLLSSEFLELARQHLKPGGLLFYNTTDSGRAQRTGCLAFLHGARLANHLVLSDAPIAWDFARWRRTLESYFINGLPVVDLHADLDRLKLEELVSWERSVSSWTGSDQAKRPIEPCSEILTRTSGKDPISDDNMGSEWRYSLGLE